MYCSDLVDASAPSVCRSLILKVSVLWHRPTVKPKKLHVSGPRATLLPISGSIASELDQPGLLRMNFPSR
jgi:hypothetical protein